MKSKIDPKSDIGKTLGIDRATGHRKHRKWWLIVAFMAIAGVTTAVVWKRTEKSNSMQYQTEKARRGDLTVTVTATGNLEPTNQVEVGSEQSGIIETLEVDYNDHVKIGQVLAKLDTSKLEAEVLQSRAALASARAKVLQTEATIKETRNALSRLEEVRKLSNNRAVSQHDLDAAQAALDRALADKASAKATVNQAQAALEANETDLSKAVIHSPINGIVLTRNVEPGQTVAASLQAPVLFTLAEDLTHMELHVSVDEADVGHVKERQEATFTVDAYPDRNFPARITQVRFGSQTVDGVVTYETVLNVDNSDLSLRPGMTATAEITVKKVRNAILVPNAALRFTPPIKEKNDPSDRRSILSRLLPRRPRSWSKRRIDATADNKKQRVWTLRDGQLVTITVMTGATNGSMTEVISGDIEPGMALVVDTLRAGQ